MARFFFYDEIVNQALTPVDDIQWIAGQIAELPAFVEGSAVLCGSVSWGKTLWRSDIDVAHFSTIAHPHVEPDIENIIERYLEGTNHKYITPRFDVITIGAESLSNVNNSKSISASSISSGKPEKKDPTSNIFLENGVLFADHIGALASLKGEPWQSFFDKHLSAVDAAQFDRRKSIRSYVEKMTTEWNRQPLHYLNLGVDKQFEAKHLDLISKSENYAVNLMRRMLGEMSHYPCPDRAPDVRESFAALTADCVKPLMSRFERFFELDTQYEALVAACRRTDDPLSAEAYYEQLRNLFVDLPFAEIQTIVWEYFGS